MNTWHMLLLSCVYTWNQFLFLSKDTRHLKHHFNFTKFNIGNCLLNSSIKCQSLNSYNEPCLAQAFSDNDEESELGAKTLVATSVLCRIFVLWRICHHAVTLPWDKSYDSTMTGRHCLLVTQSYFLSYRAILIITMM